MTEADPTDSSWMRLALAEAARGRGAVEPNPMVGAVVVDPDGVAGFGHHGRFGGPHAEVEALGRAGDRARGATLYVTLEPCCHFGKTPPCVDAVLAAGVTRVVVAMIDPFPRVAGGGLDRLRTAGLAVTVGVEEEAARRLNAPYLKRLATGLPFVTAKWAMTLDGRTACATGDSRWISNERSRAVVHEIRGRMDGIIVGIGTALADDPDLTVRPPGPRVPARVVLDSAGRLPLDGRLVRTAASVPVVVAVAGPAPADRVAALRRAGCDVVTFPDEARVPVAGLLADLGRRGMTNVLVEGGGEVIGAFLDAGQVDAVEAFLAPVLEGGTHPFTPIRGVGVGRMVEALRLEDPEVRVLDGDVHVRGRPARPRPVAGAGPSSA